MRRIEKMTVRELELYARRCDFWMTVTLILQGVVLAVLAGVCFLAFQ
jgi:hypothetical protein